MRDLYIAIGLFLLAASIAYAGYTVATSLTTTASNLNLKISA